MSSIGRSKKDKKKLSIVDAFGMSQRCNQPCNFPNEVDTHPHEDEESDSVEIVEGEQPSKKRKRTFKSKWKTRFPRAYVVKDCNGNERIKCSRCVKFKRETPFSKEGSTTLQVSGLNGQSKSEAHKFSLQFLEGETNEKIF